MARRRSMNAVTQTLPDYGPDPHGAWLHQRMTRAIVGGLTAGTVLAPRSGTFFGWGPQLQRFRGSAALGGARPIIGAPATVSQQVSTENPTTASIWAERVKRGKR
jgi:hypothetical protein